MSATVTKRRSVLARLGLAMVLLLVFVVALAVGRALYSFRDRLDGYELSLNLPAGPPTAGSLRVGFGKVNINPDLSNPAKPVWLAGFDQNRAATEIHDDLWAIACVVDDGHRRLGIVALDAIGFFHDQVVEVRRGLSGDLKLDYTIICSTHNHSTPDLMGLWGPSFVRTGVDPVYRARVVAACQQALASAVGSLEPARMALHEIPTQPANLVTDTRKPEVYDSDIRVMHFLGRDTDKTIGTIVTWGNHPETVWSENTEVTSDYCGYLRDALEKGVLVDGQQVVAGLGGTHLFINGAVGGLMSTTPSVTVRDPFSTREFKEPSHEKARALGYQIAVRVLPVLRETSTTTTDVAPIQIRARTLELPLTNKAYLLAGFLGLLDRGYVKWRTLRTEVAYVDIGGASLACLPGEVYPEIVNGGVESPEGADFNLRPVEVPPLRELMNGRVKFVFGLANDEVGYILPKSQWDEREPYTYASKKRLYGEINSVGPEVGPRIHSALKELMQAGKAIPGKSSEQEQPLAGRGF